MLTTEDRKVAYTFAIVLAVVGVMHAGAVLLGDAPSFVRCPTSESVGATPGTEISSPSGKRAGQETFAVNGQECAEDPALAKYTWQLARYTMGLLLATVLLGALGIVQLFFLVRADKAAKKAANAAEAATNRSITLAENRFLLEGRRADTTEREHGLMRAQFFAAHRPELQVRFFKKLTSVDQAIAPDNQPVRAEFTIINTGASDGRCTDSRILLGWFEREDLPNPAQADGADLVPHELLRPSKAWNIVVESNIYGGLIEAQTAVQNMMGQREKKLYLMGWFTYADGRGEEFGNLRTTFFCRVLNRETNEFEWDSTLLDWDFMT